MSDSNNKWQPIETAPKGDNQLILYCGEFICVGRWSDYYKEWEDDLGIGGLRKQPSHWMPLPNPPKTGDIEDEAN